jgi:hypothetical protein
MRFWLLDIIRVITCMVFLYQWLPCIIRPVPLDRSPIFY